MLEVAREFVRKGTDEVVLRQLLAINQWVAS